ncbi:hypothetical protein FOZ62_011506, partial [Perkinsus olseni]
LASTVPMMFTAGAWPHVAAPMVPQLSSSQRRASLGATITPPAVAAAATVIQRGSLQGGQSGLLPAAILMNPLGQPSVAIAQPQQQTGAPARPATARKAKSSMKREDSRTATAVGGSKLPTPSSLRKLENIRPHSAGSRKKAREPESSHSQPRNFSPASRTTLRGSVRGRRSSRRERDRSLANGESRPPTGRVEDW